MKQLVQRYDTGALEILDVPTPTPTGVQILVETRSSLISPGTERATVEAGSGNLLQKAIRQPKKVAQAIESVRTHGLQQTMQLVGGKMHDRFGFGYCSAGVVVAVGEDVQGFAVGDHVVTNGPHADYSLVSQTLAARIPAGVDFDAAAFTPLAAIALQGIRLASPELGETVVVYGLGLIGLLTVQLLRAAGCRVIGLDADPARVALAREFGCIAAIDVNVQDPVRAVSQLTDGIGADAVLLTLASSSDEPIHNAAAMSRKRGRLILVGVTGLALKREDFYEKELTFAVSCSYGPGRYDPDYEVEGIDYPIGYVRWTEQRNFSAILDLMAAGSLDTRQLISHRFEFAEAAKAFDVVTGRAGQGVILNYPPRASSAHEQTRRVVISAGDQPTKGAGVAALIGAGGFARSTLIPAIRDAGFDLHTVISERGLSATTAAKQFGFRNAGSSFDDVLADDDIDTVFVVTRHDMHGEQALRALRAGKHVFVEKPLALTGAEIDALEAEMAKGRGALTVGFNRRFAPLTSRLQRELAARVEPLSVIITVNAGHIPARHWTQQPEGGGRIVGEGCHFIDLSRAIVGAPIVDAVSVCARDREGRPISDIAHITLQFSDGSVAVVHYLSSGSPRHPKERIEVFSAGRTYRIDDWRELHRFSNSVNKLVGGKRQDKGHRVELDRWLQCVRGAPMPIPAEELFEVSRWTLKVAECS